MSGRLGKADLAADTNTAVYTVPADTVATANINLCNRTDTAVTVRIAIHEDVLDEADWLEYDAPLPAYGVLERTGLALSSGETLTVHASGAGVSVRVHGFEEGE